MNPRVRIFPITKWMAENGKSSDALDRIAGVPEGTVARLLRTRRPNPLHWKAIAAAIGRESDPPQELKEAIRIAEKPVINTIRVRDKAESERRRLAKDQPAEIVKRYFNFPSEPFHVEILHALFEGGRLNINLPTDHGKSIMGMQFFPLLSLMNDPDESHILCGATQHDAKRRLQWIQREIESNAELVRDYPWIAKPKDKTNRIWAATDMIVDGRSVNRPDPSIHATGFTANDSRGRRGKFIADDIEGPEARWSVLKRRELYVFMTEEAERCYEKPHESERPLLANLGTPQSVESLHFQLHAKHGWKVIRYPCYNPDGSPLWDANADKVAMHKLKMSKIAFAIAYLLDPSGGDPNYISLDQMMEWIDQSRFDEPKYVTLVSIDPASGSKNRDADYAGISVVRVAWKVGDELPKTEVLEAHRFTDGLFEQVHFCANLWAKYQNPNDKTLNAQGVVYEVDSQQGNTYANAFMHLHPEVPLIRHRTQGAKFDEKMGLTVLKTLLKDQRIHVPASEQDSEGIQTLLQEIRDLGSGELHDHIACSVWFAVRHMYTQARIYGGPQIINGYAPGAGRGWAMPYRAPYRRMPARSWR